MKQFDTSRPEFSPYGFACELWTPARMPRPDRHNEIELNLLTAGTLTYLLGGHRTTIEAAKVGVFWAAIPHQIVQFEGEAPYFVVTLPLSEFLRTGLDLNLVNRVLQGELLIDSAPEETDELVFQRWEQDLQDGAPTLERAAIGGAGTPAAIRTQDFQHAGGSFRTDVVSRRSVGLLHREELSAAVDFPVDCRCEWRSSELRNESVPADVRHHDDVLHHPAPHLTRPASAGHHGRHHFERCTGIGLPKSQPLQRSLQGSLRLLTTHLSQDASRARRATPTGNAA